MNRVILIGRLTADPELRFTQNGTAVAKFTLAVDRPFVNQEGKREADFVDIVVWRKPAENCSQFLIKGSQAAIDGRLQSRTYQTNEGQKRKVWEVIAENVRFLDKKDSTAPSAIKPESSEDFSANIDGFDDIDINLDDVPF